MIRNSMTYKILLAGLLLLLAGQMTGCSVGKTVQLDNYSPEKGFSIDKIVVPSKIESVILNNRKVINFDSTGGVYNKTDHSISGFNQGGMKAIIARDSIDYVVIRPFAEEQHSLMYDAFIEKQAIIDTLSNNYSDYYPYLAVIKNREKPGIIDTNNKIVNIKIDSRFYEQFAFDDIKCMMITRRKATMNAIRILSAIGAVTFVIIDNSDNF